MPLLTHDMKELLWRYDLDAPVCLEGKHIIIARYEILRTCCHCTGNNFVVIWITRHGSRCRWGIDDDGGGGEEAVAKLVSETLPP